MTSQKCMRSIGFSFAGVFLYIAVAYAQESPAAPPAEEASRPPTVVSSGIQWDIVRWIERRYKIEALRFKARGETGVDWPGSDEVMVGTRDVKGGTVSDEFQNIDTGDIQQFDPAKSCIVAVRPGTVVLGRTSVCDDVGEPAPLWFEVEFWEKGAWGLPPGFCIPPTVSPESGLHGGPHCVNDRTGDDFIGGARLDFAAWELEAALPNVGDEHIETVALTHCPGNEICGYGPGPWDPGDYTFTYRITRLSDVRVELREILDRAISKIGARSELEAIGAGLNALRAPRPRKVEGAR